MRCGQPRGPTVATVTTFDSERNAAISAALISICDLRERGLPAGGGKSPPECALAGNQQPVGGRQHRLAHVGGLEHGGVAGLLEDLLHEVVLALEGPLDDDR